MKTVIEPNENIESALKRFRRGCQRAGILSEVRRRAYYEKPSDVKRRKIQRAIRKRRS